MGIWIFSIWGILRGRFGMFEGERVQWAGYGMVLDYILLEH